MNWLSQNWVWVVLATGVLAYLLYRNRTQHGGGFDAMSFITLPPPRIARASKPHPRNSPAAQDGAPPQLDRIAVTAAECSGRA
jgi:hypothetical protein